MADLYGVSPTCTSVGLMLAMVDGQLSRLRQIWEELKENPEMERALDEWKLALEQADLALDTYRGVFQDAAPDASACWAAVANPMLYGVADQPPLVIDAIKLHNQVAPLLPLDAELRSASSAVGDWLLIADQELAQSAPGERRTLGDAVAEAKNNITRFVKQLTSKATLTKVAVGAGVVLAAYYLLKKR
jgi:hypothetical protein